MAVIIARREESIYDIVEAGVEIPQGFSLARIQLQQAKQGRQSGEAYELIQKPVAPLLVGKSRFGNHQYTRQCEPFQRSHARGRCVSGRRECELKQAEGRKQKGKKADPIELPLAGEDSQH